MNVAYECKFCRKPGVAILEDTAEEDFKKLGFTLSIWVTMLACDRCGIFREHRSSVIQKFRSLSVFCSGDEKDKHRDTMRKISQEWAKLLCDFHGIQTQWDYDFFNVLVDKPKSMIKSVLDYEGSIRHMAKSLKASPVTA